MNKQRRKEIKNVINQLEDLRATIEDIQLEEQEYFDNMPENFQLGERGDMANEAIGNMDDALMSIDELLSSLDCAMA